MSSSGARQGGKGVVTEPVVCILRCVDLSAYRLTWRCDTTQPASLSAPMVASLRPCPTASFSRPAWTPPAAPTSQSGLKHWPAACPDVLLLGDLIYMDRGLASLAAVPGAKRAWLAASNGNKAKLLQAFAKEMHDRYAQQWRAACFRALVAASNLRSDCTARPPRRQANAAIAVGRRPGLVEADVGSARRPAHPGRWLAAEAPLLARRPHQLVGRQ